MSTVLNRYAELECERLDDAEKEPVKGWRNLYFLKTGESSLADMIHATKEKAIRGFVVTMTARPKYIDWPNEDGEVLKSQVSYCLPMPVKS